MADPFELLSATDKPALLALSDPALVSATTNVLEGLGYKVHAASSPEDFTFRFSQIQYQLVVIEEQFSAASVAENQTLRGLQIMPMVQRRHTVVILFGDSFQTLNALQAFRQSVHAVIQRSDLPSLSQILQKAVADNNLFLNMYREVQTRITQGKA